LGAKSSFFLITSVKLVKVRSLRLFQLSTLVLKSGKVTFKIRNNMSTGIKLIGEISISNIKNSDLF
jgi:hypothetical protein